MSKLVSPCLMVHTISSNIGNNAAKFSHNSVQGHHHSLFGVQYYADKSSIRWSMSVGALLDPNSPAARYGSKAILKRPILGCGVIIGPKHRYLVISDLHLPYHHPDSFKFLQAVYEKYNCTKVLNVGDLWDHHRASYHESENDAYSEQEEFDLNMKYSHELQEIFPKMVISTGNHDALPKRKAKTLGLSNYMVKDFNSMYNLKKGWQFVTEHWFETKDSIPIVVPMILKENGKWSGKL